MSTVINPLLVSLQQLNTQPVSTTGSPYVLTITGGAHTTLTKNTEATDLNFNMARTVQFATVDTSFTQQRAVRWQAPTYGFVGSSTISSAVHFSIEGGPIAGTNAIFTRSSALKVGGWLSNGATNTTVEIEPAGIATGFGAMTEITGLSVGKAIAVTLGDQTANLTNYYGLKMGVVTFTSTTLTRTVTGDVATVYIAGAPVASTNVTFSGSAYSLQVAAGNCLFGGNVTVTGTLASTATTATLGVGVTAIPITSNVVTVTGDGGANTIATMTGGASGQRVTLIFADGLVTITDNGASPSANQFDLSAAFTSATHKSLTVVKAAAGYWVEISRSTNT